MADRFEDERGVIQDLLGPVDAVTCITTKAGYVRGNHVHHKTMQWVYVASGEMLISHDGAEMVYAPGALVGELPGVPHAWRALTDCTVLVFTVGPRSGAGFESDTERLPPERWLLHPDLCGACHQPGTPQHPLSAVSGGERCHAVCLV